MFLEKNIAFPSEIYGKKIESYHRLAVFIDHLVNDLKIQIKIGPEEYAKSSKNSIKKADDIASLNILDTDLDSEVLLLLFNALLRMHVSSVINDSDLKVFKYFPLTSVFGGMGSGILALDDEKIFKRLIPILHKLKSHIPNRNMSSVAS